LLLVNIEVPDLSMSSMHVRWTVSFFSTNHQKIKFTREHRPSAAKRAGGERPLITANIKPNQLLQNQRPINRYKSKAQSIITNAESKSNTINSELAPPPSNVY
jgi:hypothetical protein